MRVQAMIRGKGEETSEKQTVSGELGENATQIQRIYNGDVI